MTFRVEIKVKNALLWKAIMANHENVAQFSKAHGFGNGRIGDLLNLKESPLQKCGEWTKLALDVSDALGFLPDELWPEHLQRRYEIAKAAVEMTRPEVEALMAEKHDPEQLMFSRESREQVESALKTLDTRLANVLRLRFGIYEGDPKTLEEVGHAMGISAARARQLEEKALRRLRHPRVSDRLRELIPEDPEHVAILARKAQG